jgi:nucleoid-associated protein YgaU
MPMINFITRFIAAAGLAVATAVSAQQATPPLEITPGAPDRYVVVKGDTLWDIAGRFLEKPWRWPEIWDLNRESIRDPHWIYPGDVVLLDRSGAQPRLQCRRRR